MNFQASSNSSVEPDSKPWESWKIKSHPGYVIWCSISCRPLCYHCLWVATLSLHLYLTHLKWWHQVNHRLFKLITCKKFNNCRWKHKTQSLRPTHHPCHVWWALLPLLHHKPSQGWLSCLHWPCQWQGCESVGIDSDPWAFQHCQQCVSHLDLIYVNQG